MAAPLARAALSSRDIPLAAGNLTTLYSRPNDGSNPWIRILTYVATKGLTGVSAAKRWFKSGQTTVQVTVLQSTGNVRQRVMERDTFHCNEDTSTATDLVSRFRESSVHRTFAFLSNSSSLTVEGFACLGEWT